MEKLYNSLAKLEKSENQIRKHINNGVLHNGLLRNKEKWWMLCSALDVLGDTTLALSDYIKTDFPKESGLKYIYSYGVMQCFILQQDSVKHIYEVFDVEWTWHQSLKVVRQIRNASIGHTILNNDGGKNASDRDEYNNFISRISINKFGFDLLRYSKKQKDTSYEIVNIKELLINQLNQLSEKLNFLIREIEKLEQDFKKKFENQTLIDLLPISYWFEKIHSIYDVENRNFAITALNSIAESYKKLQEALRERLFDQEYWFNEIEDYLFATEMMKEALHAQDERKARILSFYLSEKNEYFKNLLVEIDEKFQIKNPL